jgi:vancomycin resistance protein YoaR
MAVSTNAAGPTKQPFGSSFVLVSRFTTRFRPGQPRVVNIRRAAALLHGMVLQTGQRFSMNAALGKRTRARACVAAPMIFGGIHVRSVVEESVRSQRPSTTPHSSQVRLITHTPHSFYIPRYPIGREATISWGGRELIFQNYWPAPLLMRLRTTRTSITVSFYSQA